MSAPQIDIVPLFAETEGDGAAEVLAVLVAYLGNHRVIIDRGAEGLVVARCLATFDPDALTEAAARGAAVTVVSAHGDARDVVVTGFASSLPARSFDVRVDRVPRRLELEAQHELVLRCGRASITLLESGRVVIKGTYVESHASGTNRIKGGQVRIN